MNSWGSYIYRIDSLYGLLDDNGKILAAPQKYEILACGITNSNDTICECLHNGYKIYLNAQLRPIFPLSYQCRFSGIGKYFIYKNIQDSKYERQDAFKDYVTNQRIGLATFKGEIILPNKFERFASINDSTIFTILTGYDYNFEKTGVFNLNTKQWILDTNYRLFYSNYLYFKKSPIIFQHRQTLKGSGSK